MGFFDDLFDPGARQREQALRENRREGDKARSRGRAIAAQTGFGSAERLSKLDAGVLAQQSRQTEHILEAYSEKSQFGGILGTLGGALIGSFIAPGVGTAVGASIGGALTGADPGLASAFGGIGVGGSPEGSIPTAGLVDFDDSGGPRMLPPATGPSSQGPANTNFLFPGLFGAQTNNFGRRGPGVGSRGIGQ